MNKIAYCKYCKDNQEMEVSCEEYYDDIEGNETIYWCECPMCGSRSPISNTLEGAIEYAVNGYD